jgi:hypothetical protein
MVCHYFQHYQQAMKFLNSLNHPNYPKRGKDKEHLHYH